MSDVKKSRENLDPVRSVKIRSFVTNNEFDKAIALVNNKAFSLADA